MQIFINKKTLGRKQKALAPAAYEIADNISTLKELLTQLVQIEVKEYNEKGTDTQTEFFLSKQQIENQAAAGKVGFGRLFLDRKANIDKAVKNAKQC